MPTKIMPLGASNTYGMYENPNSPGGYRGPLQDMLRGENLSFDFVGLDSDGRIADPQHNGYSGKPIDWFTRPVNEPIYDRDGSYSHTVNSGSQTAVQFFISRAGMTSNDVILLNAGTNDVRLGDTADKMLADMDVLLNQIVTSSASPQVQVMTLAPVGSDRWADGDPSRTNNETIEAFNEGLERLVADKYGALGVTLVDPALTTADLSSDGVHMDADGYEKMAEALFESLMDEDQVDPLPSTPGTPPPTSPPPSGGTGPDTITVRVSGDAYKGDPNFALLVNGRVVDATNLVTADRSEGEWDTLVFKGDFNLDGTDRVGIQFTNDLYTRGVGDRNLYVDSVTVNGQTNGRDHTFTRAGTEFWDV